MYLMKYCYYDTDSLGTVPEGGPDISLYKCDYCIIHLKNPQLDRINGEVL